MLNCLFCDTTLTNRQDAIKHLEIAHNMVRGVVSQEGNPGDFYQPEGCNNWQPGDKRCRCCKGSLRMNWHGLYIELKAPDVELFMKRDGTVQRQGDHKVQPKPCPSGLASDRCTPRKRARRPK